MQEYKLRNGNTIEVGEKDLLRMVVPVECDGITIEYTIKVKLERLGFLFGDEFIYFRDL